MHQALGRSVKLAVGRGLGLLIKGRGDQVLVAVLSKDEGTVMRGKLVNLVSPAWTRLEVTARTLGAG